jgi:3-hydroxyisobutyrate dehydrogenase-like beta-hydroxyacid dehydrogenase
MDVGFIGLGQMGAGMAACLLKAGHRLTVYNRSIEKAEPLRASGARLARTPGEAAAGAGVVFTMLADDAALEAVVNGPEGVLAHLPKGAVHVSSSTISVGLAQRLESTHAQAGLGFVSAPVFGRPQAAAAAKLFVVAAGAPAMLEVVAPLFSAIGQRTFIVSGKPEVANLVKLSGNFLIACVIESLGEAFALTGKAGVDGKQYLELLTSTLFGAPVYESYGRALVERRFEPAGFKATLGQKDIRLTLAAGEQLNVPMPLASLLRDRFLTLNAHGRESLDWAAVGALAAEDAGMGS